VFFIFLALFAVCAGLVLVISVFGVQGESFEEALEKQKKNQSKEKEKKKQPTEKKKKVKKGKDAKNNNVQDSVDENLLVDPSGHVVEPVFVEPVVAEVVAAAPARQKKDEVKQKPKQRTPAPPVVAAVKEEIIVEKVVVAAAQAQCSAPEPLATPQVVLQEAAIQKQAAAVKEVKSERKKIEIIEVDIEPKVEETEEKKKKKAPKDKQPKKSTKSHCDEIMETIRKSPLSDTEAQSIVDILLLKQTGKEENADDWIEPGKENESKKMARQIAELRVELEEETGKASNLEKKMITLRKEVNESKSGLAQYKREHEELVNKKSQEITGLNSRLQQVMGQLNSSVTLQRQLETNQSHYQATINNLQTQLSQVSSNAATDPKLLAEMEQLKSARNELTASQHSLQQQLAQKCADVERLTAANQQIQTEAAEAGTLIAAKEQTVQGLRLQLDQAKSDDSRQLETVAQLREQLAQHIDGSKLTDGKIEAALSGKQQLESSLEAVTQAKQQLQLELSALKEKLSEKEVENTRLTEDNERLSEQVASSVERPTTEGEEANKVNGHPEADLKLEEVKSTEKMWDEKYTKLTTQLQDTEERYKQVDTELQSTKSEVARLKGKNEESVKLLAEQEQNCVEAFARLFPDLDKTQASLSSLEKQAKSFIQDLEKSSQTAVNTDHLTEEITKLEAQNSNYKTVLAQTEDMLTNLESSVKSAEGDWKKKLETVESGCKQYKETLDQLTTTNGELHSQIAALNSKIKDLEAVGSELEEEKSAKDILAKKCVELQQLVAAGQQHINNHSDKEVVANGTSAEA